MNNEIESYVGELRELREIKTKYNALVVFSQEFINQSYSYPNATFKIESLRELHQSVLSVAGPDAILQ